jgi:hypothetical protein
MTICQVANFRAENSSQDLPTRNRSTNNSTTTFGTFFEKKTNWTNYTNAMPSGLKGRY